MTPQDQIELYQRMDEEILSITRSKAHDYAGADVLSNFKGVSAAAKALGIDVTNPTGYAMFMVLLKIARLTNLLSAGKTPNNESIDDSFKDAVNYMKLSYCCYVDSEEKPDLLTFAKLLVLFEQKETVDVTDSSGLIFTIGRTLDKSLFFFKYSNRTWRAEEFEQHLKENHYYVHTDTQPA